MGKLCAWTCIQTEVRRQLRRDDVTPGMITAIQTHGELVHWHPQFHTLVTCGVFTARAEFLEVPELDVDRLRAGAGMSVPARLHPLDFPLFPVYP